jgi:mycothiol synthase
VTAEIPLPPGAAVRDMSARDLPAVATLCERELAFDQEAGSLPGILARRPYAGLVAARDSAVLGACFGAVGEGDDTRRPGFIDLLVVDRAERRHGIARRLVLDMEKELATRGCRMVMAAGHDVHYAWPGIDLRYTAAISLAEELGYHRTACEVDMEVDLLTAPLETAADEERLRSAGIEVRCAGAGDEPGLRLSLASTWVPEWVAATTAALRDDAAGLHIALRGRRCVGFCAYGVNRHHEVGPLGTAPDLRGLGIGSVLLKRCLAEQRDRGLRRAELVWAGPLSFFARTVAATISRAYFQYEKDLADHGHVTDWRGRIGLIAEQGPVGEHGLG